MDFDGVLSIGFGDKIERIAGPLSDQIGSSGIADDDYRIEFRVDAPCGTLDDVAFALDGLEGIEIDGAGADDRIAYRGNRQFDRVGQRGIARLLDHFGEFADGENACRGDTESTEHSGLVEPCWTIMSDCQGVLVCDGLALCVELCSGLDGWVFEKQRARLLHVFSRDGHIERRTDLAAHRTDRQESRQG